MHVPAVSLATREARLRRNSAKYGFALRKSRLRGPIHINDYGEYRVVDPFHNAIVLGEKFDWSLEEFEAWLEGNEA